jgi:hypothetical protein
MRRGSERGASVDAKQWRKNQRLQAAPTRRLARMHQGTVGARRRVFMRLSPLRALGHNRAKGRVLVAPRGTQMHADKGQTGRHLDEMPLRLSVFFETWLGVAALALD